MKKAFFLSVIFFGTIYSAFAQYYGNHDAPTGKLGVGISSGFTTGAFSGAFPGAGDLSFKLELPVGKSQLMLLLSTGYTFYVSSSGYDAGFYYGNYGASTYSAGAVASFIPVEAGLKLHITRRLFIEGDAGISFNINNYPLDYTGKPNAFIYSPAVGFSFPFGFTDKQNLDLSLLYENRPETGGGYEQVALRAVFNFGL